MLHSLKMYFHVDPKKRQVHQNESLKLLMKIARITIKMVRWNLDVAKEHG